MQGARGAPSGCHNTRAPEIEVPLNLLCAHAPAQGFTPVVLNTCVG